MFWPTEAIKWHWKVIGNAVTESGPTSITMDKETKSILDGRKPRGVNWERWLLEETGGVPDGWGSNDE